jgi:hypothetical protein
MSHNPPWPVHQVLERFLGLPPVRKCAAETPRFAKVCDQGRPTQICAKAGWVTLCEHRWETDQDLSHGLNLPLFSFLSLPLSQNGENHV